MAYVSAKEYLTSKNDPAPSAGGGYISANDFLDKKAEKKQHAIENAQYADLMKQAYQINPDAFPQSHVQEQDLTQPRISAKSEPTYSVDDVLSGKIDNPKPKKEILADRNKPGGTPRSIADNLIIGFGDKATFGLLPKLMGEQTMAEDASHTTAGQIGGFAGDILPASGAYKAANAVVKGAGLVKNVARGAIAGGAYDVAKQGIDMGLDTQRNGDQSWADRAIDFGTDTALFAGGDAAIGLIGKFGPKIGQAFENWRVNRNPQAEQQATDLLALPPGRGEQRINAAMERSNLVPNDAPIAGTGNVHTFELPDPQIPNILKDIKEATYQRITPPLENSNELAKWVQSHLGIDNISLNEVRKLPYDSLREMADLMRQRMSPRETAAQVAKEKGYDLNDLIQGRSVTGNVDSPVTKISFDRPELVKNKPNAVQMNSTDFTPASQIDYPFENVPIASPVLEVPTSKIGVDDIADVSPEPKIRNRVNNYTDEIRDAALARIKANRNMGIVSNQSNVVVDYAIVGVSYLIKGTVKLADFAEQMVREFGEEVRPHVRDIFKKSKEFYKEYEKRVQKDMQGLKDIPLPLLKDINGHQAYTNDVYRNFEQVFADKHPQIKKAILDPFDDAKKANIDMQEQWLEKLKTEVVDKLGIQKGSKLSSLVQQYGEKTIDLLALQKEVPNDWQKVVDADRWFRKSYDELIDSVNKTRAHIYPGNPEKIIPKRSDYYRHFQEYNSLSGLKNLFDTPAQIDPSLVGISEFLTPKSKWASFMQQRGVGPFKNDAVGGFLNYIPSASYATHIDPQIDVFKNLSKNLAEDTTDSKNLNNFINFLQRFSQDLGGKTNPADRFIQEVIPGGRKTMAAVQWLNNRVKANTILGNLSSTLAQGANIPNGIAFAKQYSIKGAGETFKSIFKPNDVIQQSPFLKERFSGQLYRQFNTKWIDQPRRFAEWMMETADRFGTQFVWNSVHAKGVAEGVENPINFADNETRKLIAGRGIGEVPLLQKSKLFQLIAPFQLEVANLWKVQKEFLKEKDFGALATLYVGSFLLNQAMVQIRGSGVTFDPIQAIVEASQEGLSPTERVGRVAGEVLSNVPLGQTAASIYPENGFNAFSMEFPNRKKLFGDNDPTRFGGGILTVKGIQDPLYKLILPFGGSQLKKSIQGADAVASGGANQKTFVDDALNLGKSDGDKLKFPIDINNPIKVAQTLALGPNSTSEAQSYYKADSRPLSEDQTKMLNNSTDPQKTYSSITKDREFAKIERQLDDVRNDTKLSNEEKLIKIRLLQKKLQEVKQKK